MKYNNICCLFFNQPGKENIFVDQMKRKIATYCVLKNVGILGRAIRKIHIKTGLPGMHIWFTDWYKDIKKYDIIICVATEYSIPVLRWIRRKVSNETRLINYYWDEIEISGYPIVYDKKFENWSFNKNNSDKYNMRYNPQFWIKTMNLETENCVYDVSCVAGDRNGKYAERTELVNKLYSLLCEKKLKSFFWYVSSSDLVKDEIKRDKDLTQREFLECIKKSKSIIELTEKDNPWITQRTLYALSNKKKLITNNYYIIDEKFYNSNNIFIIGRDDLNNLESFIKSPFQNIEEEALTWYELEEWIKRFYVNVENS